MSKPLLSLREAYELLQKEIEFDCEYETFRLWAKNDVGINARLGVKYPIDLRTLDELRSACLVHKVAVDYISRNKDSRRFALQIVRQQETWTGKELLKLLTSTRTISKPQLYRRNPDFSTRKQYSRTEAQRIIFGLTNKAIVRSA